MKFGIREVCNCTFTSTDSKALNFTIDTAKMTTLEGASTTVYAQGGRGFSRLAAWEGERTLTFTVEDALLTTESFQALIGRALNGNQIKITTTDFAGYYSIVAETLVRDVESGQDKAATITIPRAKLQSNLNIPMAPNGDPAAFTFTFDAFPVNGELCVIDIVDATTTTTAGPTTVSILTTSGYKTASTTAEAPILKIDGTAVKLSDETVAGVTVSSTQMLTNMSISLNSNDEIHLKRGSSTYWYVV
jgi:hypothetical protein